MARKKMLADFEGIPRLIEIADGLAREKTNRRKGLYIVIEGQDATGKSTQVDLLVEYFRRTGRKVMALHETVNAFDGNLPVANEIADILKNASHFLEPETCLALFTAMRIELWNKVARDFLDKDGIVISSGNWISGLAFQGCGQGVPIDFIEWNARNYLPDRYVNPDKTLILVLPEKKRAELLRARGGNKNGAKDTFESQGEAFQKRVTDAYPLIARRFGFAMIDASGAIEDVFEKIVRAVDID